MLMSKCKTTVASRLQQKRECYNKLVFFVMYDLLENSVVSISLHANSLCSHCLHFTEVDNTYRV